MKVLKTVTLISGFIGLAGAMLPPSAMSAPGKGWDTFHTGQGEPIPAASKGYMGVSLGVSAGKGWDTFHTGQGDKLP